MRHYRGVAALPWIVEVIIAGATYDLVKSGAEWVLRNPPPPGKRPPVLYANGYVFHRKANGHYEAGPIRAV